MKYMDIKISALLLSASVVFGLSGCGSEGIQSDTQLVGSTVVTPPGVTPPGVTPPPPELTCLESAGYRTVTVENGQIWLDRNLGASRVANTVDDTAAYGNLYQWGRGADGHESRSASVINEDGDTYATVIAPNAGNAWDGRIINDPDDWTDWVDIYSDEEDPSLRVKLWSTASNAESNKNQVCPCGFVVPSEADYAALTASAIVSLKFTYGGYRLSYDNMDGVIEGFDRGYYWTTGSNGRVVESAIFDNNAFTNTTTPLSDGLSVRCIDPSTSIPDES